MTAQQAQHDAMHAFLADAQIASNHQPEIFEMLTKAPLAFEDNGRFACVTEIENEDHAVLLTLAGTELDTEFVNDVVKELLANPMIDFVVLREQMIDGLSPAPHIPVYFERFESHRTGQLIGGWPVISVGLVAYRQALIQAQTGQVEEAKPEEEQEPTDNVVPFEKPKVIPDKIQGFNAALKKRFRGSDAQGVTHSVTYERG